MGASVQLTNLDRLLSSAERAVALLDRCRPINAARETERVIEAWERRVEATPDYRYAPAPDLTDVARALDTIATHAEQAGPWGMLYAARALELLKEARIVEALGTDAFRERARERFTLDAGGHGTVAAVTARAWAALTVPAAHRCATSDDNRDPESLVSVLRALVGSMRLPIRIVATMDLACAAAAGDGFIVIRRGVRHRSEAARRIALHEILGHALPRLCAKTEVLGLLSVGTAGGAEDEEGRALLIEERHGLLDDERRRELGVRHLAAVAVRSGADWIDVVRLAVAHGLSMRDSVHIAARVLRGGGLAREIIYLPARERVRQALEAAPALESWLERGRVAIDAARTMAALGPLPTHFTLVPIDGPVHHRNVAMTGT